VGFKDDCDDQGRGDTGEPYGEIALTWQQGDVVAGLGTVQEIDGNGAFSQVVLLPEDALAGEASVVTELAEPLSVIVTGSP
jgi:hypothetical protein